MNGMLTVFRNAWVDTSLRKKILYTLFILLLFRLGSCIFVPFLDNNAITEMISGASLLNYLDVMTGGALGKGTLLAMSITPYINASIIIQLLCVAIPPLERLSKEGETGQKKLNKITKYTALGIAVLQAVAFYFSLRKGIDNDNGHTAILRYGDVNDLTSDKFSVILSAITIVGCFVAGASVIIWLGDRINEKGIGNGISMILFAGIGVYFVSSAAGLVTAGIGCAPVYPSIIHATPSRFGKENSQAVVGIQMASAYTGSTFMPPLFGLVAQSVSISLYPFWLLVFAFLTLFCSELLERCLKNNTK